MTEENVVLYEKKGPIAFLTFNRPDQMNAVSQEVYDALEDACGQWLKNLEGRAEAMRGGFEFFARRPMTEALQAVL